MTDKRLTEAEMAAIRHLPTTMLDGQGAACTACGAMDWSSGLLGGRLCPARIGDLFAELRAIQAERDDWKLRAGINDGWARIESKAGESARLSADALWVELLDLKEQLRAIQAERDAAVELLREASS